MTAQCPVCDGMVSIAADVEESEIITCAECENRVVVAQVNGSGVSLENAPAVEEDWGE